MGKQDESVLLQRAKFMDGEARRLLVEQTCGAAGFVALKLARSEAAVPNILAGAYRQVFARLSTLEDGAHFVNALKCAAASLALRAAKDGPGATEAPPRFSLGELDYKESRQFMEWAFDQLADEQRAILLLRDAQDISSARAARTLGVSENTAKRILHGGRGHIRAQVKALKKSGGALCDSAPLPFLVRLLKQAAFSNVLPMDTVSALWKAIGEPDTGTASLMPAAPAAVAPPDAGQAPRDAARGAKRVHPAKLVVGVAVGGIAAGGVLVALIFMLPAMLHPENFRAAIADGGSGADINGKMISEASGGEDGSPPADVPAPEDLSVPAEEPIWQEPPPESAPSSPATGAAQSRNLSADNTSPLFSGGYTLDFPVAWCGNATLLDQGGVLEVYHKQIYDGFIQGEYDYNGLLFTVRVVDTQTYEKDYLGTLLPEFKIGEAGGKVAIWEKVADFRVDYANDWASDYLQMGEEAPGIVKTLAFQ